MYLAIYSCWYGSKNVFSAWSITSTLGSSKSQLIKWIDNSSQYTWDKYIYIYHIRSYSNVAKYCNVAIKYCNVRTLLFHYKIVSFYIYLKLYSAHNHFKKYRRKTCKIRMDCCTGGTLASCASTQTTLLIITNHTWFQAYITHQRQYVSINGSNSYLFPVNEGIFWPFKYLNKQSIKL